MTMAFCDVGVYKRFLKERDLYFSLPAGKLQRYPVISSASTSEVLASRILLCLLSNQATNDMHATFFRVAGLSSDFYDVQAQ